MRGRRFRLSNSFFLPPIFFGLKLLCCLFPDCFSLFEFNPIDKFANQKSFKAMVLVGRHPFFLTFFSLFSSL